MDRFAYTKRDHFKQSIERFAGVERSVPNHVIANVESFIRRNLIPPNKITESQIKTILEQLSYQECYPDIYRYITEYSAPTISKREKKELMLMFEYSPLVGSDRFNPKAYLVKLRLGKYRRAFTILNRVYRNRCAQLIQRVWDRYWYSPNEKGESKAGKAGYERFMGK